MTLKYLKDTKIVLVHNKKLKIVLTTSAKSINWYKIYIYKKRKINLYQKLLQE